MKYVQLKSWSVLALTVAALALPAVAQQAGTNAPTATPYDRTLGRPQRANLLLGHEVRTSDNQSAGKLSDLVLTLQSDRILYAIIDTGHGKVAVAPGVFTSGTPNNLRVNVAKQKIDSAPQVAGNMTTPDQLANPGFVTQVTQYYGQQAWWQSGSTPLTSVNFGNVQLASKLPGMKVENVDNQPIGMIHNVVVDLPTGRVTYAILEPNANMQLSANDFYALPPEALTWNASRNTLVSNITRDKLAAAPHFNKNDWTNLSNPSFASQVYQYYGKQPYFQGGGLQPTGR